MLVMPVGLEHDESDVEEPPAQPIEPQAEGRWAQVAAKPEAEATPKD